MNSLLRVVAWLVVVVAALCAIVYYTYADVWTVPIDDPRMLVSIEPTLRGGDLVLVQRHGEPVIGSLVQCVDPDEPRRWVVGRLVQSGGLDVEIRDQGFATPGSRPHGGTSCDKRMLVNPANGEEVDLNCRTEEFAGREYQTLSRNAEGSSHDSVSSVHVPLGRSFLLSDDRYLHLDSRDFGSVPDGSCRRILFRLWGADGFSDGAHRFNIIW